MNHHDEVYFCQGKLCEWGLVMWSNQMFRRNSPSPRSFCFFFYQTCKASFTSFILTQKSGPSISVLMQYVTYLNRIKSLNQSWTDLRDRSWYPSFVNPFELYPNFLNHDKWIIWYYVFCNKSLSKRVLFWVELDLLKLSNLDSGWC